MSDRRIRFQVADTRYFRKLTLSNLTVELSGNHAMDLSDVPINEIEFNGRSILLWILGRISMMYYRHPIVKGHVKATFKFIRPLGFTTPKGDIEVTQLNFSCTLTGGWFEYEAGIDATNGLYDWIRKRVQISGPGQFQIRGFDPGAGTLVERPPERVLNGLPFLPGEIDMDFVLIHRPIIEGPSPPLDQYIDPADLVPEVTLTEEAFLSTPGYVHPPLAPPTPP